MIMRRLTTSLKEQHWMTILIELLIVIIGVFVGTQVSNWNETRLEKLQTERMLDQMRPEIDAQLGFIRSAQTYFATAKGYAAQALAGWRGDPKIDNNQFVIAAYQASQIYGIGINPQTWGITFGGEQLRNIDDTLLRRSLATILTTDYTPLGFNAVSTPYREHVRQLIPGALQDRIRAACGDRNIVGATGGLTVDLPKSCALKLDPAAAKSTAAALRAHPELVGELNWHLAAIATYLENADGIWSQMMVLRRALERNAA